MVKQLFIIACITFSLSCRERTNIFDIGADDFVSPPHLGQLEIDSTYYDPHDSTLIGIKFIVPCTEPFQRTLPLVHRLYYSDTIMLLEHTADVPEGTILYSIYVFGPYELGEYSLRHYFGEMPIGAGFFRVVDWPGRLIVEGVTTSGYLYKPANEWSLSIEY
jgi:hypothetical protein